MSRIWTHVDDHLDRATPVANQQTIHSNTHNNRTSATTHASSTSSSNALGLTSLTPPSARPTSTPTREIPTFSVRNLFSANSLTTSLSSKFGFSLASSLTRSFRARSEPVRPKDDDLKMDTNDDSPRARSEYNMRFRPDGAPCDTTDDIEKADPDAMDEEEESSQSLFNAQRAPSPALTEADNQDPLYIFTRLDTLEVIRRDFAFAPPFTSQPDPSLFKKGFDEKNITQPAVEIFDQFKGLTEIDYRWTQPTRTYPVSGKTLRRLLNMGWLSVEELHARGHPMDFKELEKTDSRPLHPWKPFRTRSSPLSVPSAAERRDMLNAKKGYWFQYDKHRMFYDREMKYRMEEQMKVDAILTEQDKRLIGKGKGREMSPSTGLKRPHEEDAAGGAKPANLTTKGYLLGNGNPAKKRRITPERGYPPSLGPMPPSGDPHRQQVMPPVPRNSSSQPRPGEREDTPPLEEPESQGTGSSPRRGPKLVHPKHQKAMKRALSRTQTYAQL